MKMIKASYSGKPFTEKDIEKAIEGINDVFDEKRTVCNVLRMAYKCLDKDSHNLEAAKSLVLEAFWMGKRMHHKLSENKKAEIKSELDDDDEEFAFSVDWDKYKEYPAKGNWD